MATLSSILAWRIPWNVQFPWGCNESDMTERLSFHFTVESVSREIEEGHFRSLAVLDEHLLYTGALNPHVHPSALLLYTWGWALLKPQ